MSRTITLAVILVGLVFATLPHESVLANWDHELESHGGTASLQQALKEKGFYRGPIDGNFGAETQQAVMAFRKEIGVSRSFSWNDSHWDELTDYVRPRTPLRLNESNRIEVNLTRQVMYLYREGTLVGIFPVSTGNGASYENNVGSFSKARTPTGNFTINRHRRGWRISYLGALWNPWYFVGGYALHGSLSVPAGPASHGCVRLTMWDSDFLESYLEIGMPVHIWYESSGTVSVGDPGSDSPSLCLSEICGRLPSVRP